MFIEGFGISSYRSFGNKIQFIGPCNRINFIIGKNNSGKSNILRFLNDHYQDAVASARSKNSSLKLSELDKHLGQNTGNIQIAFGLKRDGQLFNTISQNRQFSDDNNISVLLDRILLFDEMTRGYDVSWFAYEANYGQALTISSKLIEQLSNYRATNQRISDEAIDYYGWANLLSRLGNRSARAHNKDMVKDAFPLYFASTEPSPTRGS